jgi:hypothetical protein
VLLSVRESWLALRGANPVVHYCNFGRSDADYLVAFGGLSGGSEAKYDFIPAADAPPFLTSAGELVGTWWSTGA